MNFDNVGLQHNFNPNINTNLKHTRKSPISCMFGFAVSSVKLIMSKIDFKLKVNSTYEKPNKSESILHAQDQF
jgi:CTP:phosphocholine cytidylyltransferase-like protein